MLTAARRNEHWPVVFINEMAAFSGGWRRCAKDNVGGGGVRMSGMVGVAGFACVYADAYAGGGGCVCVHHRQYGWELCGEYVCVEVTGPVCGRCALCDDGFHIF